jgi:endoglucanase
MRRVIGCCALTCALFDALLTPTRAANQPASVIHVRLNQAGFRPDDIKTAVVFGERVGATTFAVVNVDGGTTVLEGSLQRLDGRWGAFSEHHQAEFSTVRKPGRYCVQVGEARSTVFAIADDVSAAFPDQLLDYMRQQRCGYNPWLDAVCHRHDGRTAFGPMPDGTWLDASGGWHDAGDLLKYLLTSSNATAQLLLAYRLSPRVFGDRVNSLGRTQANGIADVLDEARWGLDWMLKLHRPSSPGALSSAGSSMVPWSGGSSLR